MAGVGFEGAARPESRLVMLRSGANGGAVRARNEARQFPILLATGAAVYGVMMHVTSADPSRVAGCFGALGVAMAALVLRPFVVMLVMVCLGCRVVRIRVGAGPFTGVRLIGGRVVTFRTIPITFSAAYLPPPRQWGRDLRIMYGTIVLSPFVLSLVGIALVPPYARVLCPIIGLGYSAVAAFSLPEGSRRGMAARAFGTPTAADDPQLAEPNWGYLANGLIAARFGELAEAAADLQYLRDASDALGNGIEVLIERVQGDYAPVARAYTAELRKPTSSPLRATLVARLAFVTLLMAEREPGLEARAVAFVDQTLSLRGAAATSAEALPAAALRALLAGDTVRCLNLTQRQLAVAASPLEIADALCTRARAQAAAGRTEAAYATIHRAIGIAPWYTRVGIVQQLLGAEPSAMDLSVADLTVDARLFEDPWSTSEA